mmetsp:Transcript_11828/g.18159  ORF Transcript_11828/g.18159 Transcript_11828/m.18159 type:complete len:362 (+) Transcript_11828:60-1145(+)
MMQSVRFFLFFFFPIATKSWWGTLTPQTQGIGRISAGPLEISEMGCGTWSWGNRLLFDYDPQQDEEIYEAYRRMRNAGVTIFDTADSYGTLDLNGRAEILLGKFERRYLGENTSTKKSKQQVATKLAPYPWRLTRSSVVEAARGSLRRLEDDQVAIAQLHWSASNYFPFQERALWEGIGDVYEQGLCQAVGVSNYGPQQLQKVAAYFQDRGVPLAVAQIQYSLLTYKACQDMTDTCEEVNCRLLSYSPLCLGLLTGKYNVDNLPKAGPRRQLFRELLPSAQDLLGTLEAVARDYDKSIAQVAINWALCKGTVPIPGARTLSMAEENVSAANFRLRADAVDELDRVAASVRKPMIQNIFQTK